MQELADLAIQMNLPALLVEQLTEGQRMTMWSEELELVRPRVWGVYQDVPGKFCLQLKIQGYTGSEQDGFPFSKLPEDIAAAAAAKDENYWEIQGYVAVMEQDLEPDVLSAMKKLQAWTQEAAEQKKAGVKPNYKQCPLLFFVPANENSGLQLLPKINKQGELSFSGWAYKELEWRGTGIGTGAEVVPTDEYFENGRRKRGFNIARNTPQEPVVPYRGRGSGNQPIPNIPSYSDVPY